MLRLWTAGLVAGLVVLSPTVRVSACGGSPPCDTPTAHPPTSTLPANVGGVRLDDGIYWSETSRSRRRYV